MKKRHMDKVYLVNHGVERAQPQFRYLMRQPGSGCLRIGAVMKLLLRFSRATDASSFQRSLDCLPFSNEVMGPATIL